ncbi:SDR family oxidoreductase [Tumebacillus lipolyticus]|uniref:SDR family oxidoreductase n=1 Tax=Tumebacillus lipolyticus TaxID=1280370 RepID=A0ABW4ZZ06_9BACL
MNLLVTGATGFLGKHLVQKLLQEGHKLILFVRQKAKAQKVFGELLTNSASISFLEGTLTEESLEQIPQVDAIIHSAAYLSFDPAQQTETYQTNVIGTKALLERAKALGSPKFFYISTAFTLGEELDGHEQLYSTDRRFVNEYERTKCIAEHLVCEYSTHFPTSIIRPSIIIGDSKTGEANTTFGLYGLLRAADIFRRRLSRSQGWDAQTQTLLCDPAVTANLVPVDYVADVVATALQHGQANTIYNVTNPNPPRQGDIFELIKERLSFPNLQIRPFSYAGPLTPESQQFNSPLSVFKSYWHRSIRFDSTHTKEMLAKAGKQELDLDLATLRFIIQSY